MHQFDEWHPRFAGLSELYETEIRAGLKGRDPARRQALIESVATMLVALALAALVLVGSLWLRDTRDIDTGLGPFLAVVCVGFGIWLVKRRIDRVRDDLKRFIMGPVCRLLELDFSIEATAEPLSHFRGLHLIPRYDRHHVEDQISGRHEGVPFFLVEAELFQRSQRRGGFGRSGGLRLGLGVSFGSGGGLRIGGSREERRVFRGLLIYLGFPKPFQGRTILTRDRGWLGNVFDKLGKPGERVRLEDPRFEEVFEVYGSDQVEARYLLTPGFMERLLELAEAIGKGGLQLAFDSDKLMIAVESREDQFEGGSLVSSLEDPARVQTIVDQIGRIFRIIEILNLSLTSRA